MKAALLAAGKGKRLRPITMCCPKPLIPLAGISLIEYDLFSLRSLGVEDVHIVAGHMKTMVVNNLADGSGFGLHLRYLDQYDQLGTGHAVSLLSERLGGEKFLLIYSDVFFRLDHLRALIDASTDFDHLVALAEVDEPWEYGVVELEGGLIRRIVEKPPKGEEPSRKVIAGLFSLSPSIFTHLASVLRSPRGEFELTDAIEKAARSEAVGSIDLGGDWSDSGSPCDLLEASERLFDEVISNFCRLSIDGLTRQAGLLLSGESRVSGSATVEGPTYIGSGVTVGNGAQLGPYVVLCDGATVGRNASVSRSIFMPNSSIGANSSIQRSVLAPSASIGEDASLSRRPGPGEFGVLLGEKSMIGRGVVVNPMTVVNPNEALIDANAL